MSSVPLLEFHDVSKEFRVGPEVVHAVDGVSFSVPAGVMVALVGPSGSGKSTLLRIAAALERPDRGGVLVDGRDVTALSRTEAARYRRELLGLVGQDFRLFEGASALDAAGTKAWVADRSVRAARKRLTPLLAELGLQHRMHQRVETLSRGEQQRIAIARALSLDPRIVLADEPTASLDRHRGEEVIGLLKQLTRDRQMATVLVTHDEHAAAFADETYVLLDGALATAGRDAATAP
jgi:putative ABC transport system ATP-binding protein